MLVARATSASAFMFSGGTGSSNQLSEVLADDVPARDVERAQDRDLGQLRNVAVAGPSVDPIEQLLGVVRVVAHQRLIDEIVDHRADDWPPKPDREKHHLPVAGDPLVGVQAQHHPVRPAGMRDRHRDWKRLDAGHLHAILDLERGGSSDPRYRIRSGRRRPAQAPKARQA